MDIKSALRSRLLAVPSLSTLVGASRVYSYKAPADRTKACVIFGQSGGNAYWRRLDSAGEVVQSDWQLDAYGSTWTEAHQLEDAIRLGLEFTGPAAWSGISVMSCVVQDAQENPEYLDDGSGDAKPRVTITARIKYLKT